MQKFNVHKQAKVIGERVKDVRLSQKLTMSEFGRELFGENDTEQNQRIFKLESGTVLPTVAFLTSLNEKFDISPEYILFGEIDPKIKRLYDALRSRRIGQKIAVKCEKLALKICPFFTSSYEERDFCEDEDYLGYVDSDDQDNTNICSLRIKKLFKLHNLKQSEVAKILRVSKSTVSEWTNKSGLPSLEVLFSLHYYFGLSVDYILLGSIMPFHNKLYWYFRESNYEIQRKFLDECIKILENF